MSERRLRWGVLSTARIGRSLFIPGVRDGKDGEVVAVASRDLSMAQKVAKELRIGRAFGSYEELLADAEIDAVYNPLPNSLHADWTIKAAQAGKS